MNTVTALRSRKSSITSQQSIYNKGQSKAGLAGTSKVSKSVLPSARGTRASPAPSKKGGVNSIPEEGRVSNRPKSTETIRFVYSMAVTKALKKNYHVTQFGPPSATPTRQEAAIEITHLPKLYSDFKLITGFLESNRRHMDKIMLELDPNGEVIRPAVSHRGGSKFPHLSLKNNSISKNSRGRSKVAVANTPPTTVPKFPSIT